MSEPEKDDPRRALLARVGATLLRCQVAERHLKRCLVRVFPGERDEIVTLELLNRLERTHSPQTLGQLLGALRNSMDVAAGFDEKLKRFLANRNILAHGLLDLPGFSVGNFNEVNRFLDQLYSDAAFVGDVFYDFLARWSQQLGDANLAESMNSLSEGRIRPYLDSLVWPKQHDV